MPTFVGVKFDDSKWTAAYRRTGKRRVSYVGVKFDALSEKWRATYEPTGGKCVELGLFESQIEAALAFDVHARSVLDAKEASRIVNFTRDRKLNLSERICRMVLNKIEESVSECTNSKKRNNDPTTKVAEASSNNISNRFLSFVKMKLSNALGLTSENKQQFNINRKNLSIIKSHGNIYLPSTSSIEKNNVVVDTKRALREKNIVNALSNETLMKDVVKRLGLKASASDLQTLNTKRCSWRSHLTKTLLNTKDGFVPLGTIGVFAHTNGQYVAHRAYKGKDYFSDTLYKTKKDAARASDALALTIHKGSIPKDIVLNFPSQQTSLTVNVTTMMPGVPLYRREPKTGKYMCLCGKLFSRHGNMVRHFRISDKSAHHHLIMFRDQSKTMEQDVVGVTKTPHGYVCQMYFSDTLFYADRRAKSLDEAARVSDALVIKLEGCESYSPLERMMKCPRVLNCPGEYVPCNIGVTRTYPRIVNVKQEKLDSVQTSRKIVNVKQEKLDSVQTNKRTIDMSVSKRDDVVVKREFKKLKPALNLVLTKRRMTNSADSSTHYPDKMYFFRQENLGVFPCFLPLKNVEPIFIGWTDDECCDSSGNVLSCAELYKRYNAKTGTRKRRRRWIRSWEAMICDISDSEIAKLHFWTFIVSREADQKSHKRLAFVWCAALMKILWRDFWRSHPDNQSVPSTKHDNAIDMCEIKREFSSLEEYVKRIEVSSLCSLLLSDEHCTPLLRAVQIRKRLQNVNMLAQSVSEFIIRNLKEIMDVRDVSSLSLSLSHQYIIYTMTNATLQQLLREAMDLCFEEWKDLPKCPICSERFESLDEHVAKSGHVDLTLEEEEEEDSNMEIEEDNESEEDGNVHVIGYSKIYKGVRCTNRRYEAEIYYPTDQTNWYYVDDDGNILQGWKYAGLTFYDREIDAARAYDKMATRYFGSDAITNFDPRTKNGIPMPRMRNRSHSRR